MPDYSLKNELSTLVFESEDGDYLPKIYLTADGEKRLVLEGEDYFTLHVEDEPLKPKIKQIYSGDVLNVDAEFDDIPDLTAQLTVIPEGDRSPRFDWKIRLVNRSDRMIQCRAHISFKVMDSGDPRWMVPAMFYKHNRPANCVRRYPRYSANENNPEEFVSNYWAFRSDRCSMPAVFCWTDNFTTCLATVEAYGENISGVGFEGGENTRLMLNFPYVEEPVKYSFIQEDGVAPEKTTMPLFPGMAVEFTFSTFVDEREFHAYDGFIRDRYDEAEDEVNPWMTKKQADELLAYGLHRWHYDPEHKVLHETCSFDKYFAKNERNVDRPHMHVAWVSGAPYAYALWRYGVERDVSEYQDAGLSVLDKIADEGLSPCGLFYPEWTLENGWGTGWNPNPEWIQARTVSEASWFYVQALEFAAKENINRPNWESAVRSNLDVALKVQREDGNFGSYYHIETGEVQEWDGAGGLMWIPALLAAAHYFNDEKYRVAAEKAGEYYAKFVEDEYIYGAPEDVHLTPTSEDGYNALIAYVHLFEATKDQRWLDLAQRAADWAMTFRWTYNTHFSPLTILGAYDFRTFGGDIASPSNNHIHNYGLICHPELLRLWQYTGDTYYLSRAVDHMSCFLQFIAREDGDFNARKGMITEQWFHTDWTHAKGSMLQLAHCWCAGLILYANAYTREFGDIIIDADSREIYVLDSVWIKDTEEVENDVAITLVNPSIHPVNLSVRHSRAGIVGEVYIEGMEEIRIRAGERTGVDILEDEGELWQ